MEEYVSEADFCCQFLAFELRKLALGSDMRLHLEVPVNELGRADLTLAGPGAELLVIEAKLGKEPWNMDVVLQAFRYAGGRFRYFATCDTTWLVLFSAGPDPFRSAIASIYLREEGWSEQLLALLSGASPLHSLYPMLIRDRVLSAEDANTFQSLVDIERAEGAVPSENAPSPGFRLVAYEGPEEARLGTALSRSSLYPREVGRYWTIDGRGGARDRRRELELLGYKVRVQKNEGGSWTDFDIDQAAL